MRVKCIVDIQGVQKLGEQDGFAKVVYGRPDASLLPTLRLRAFLNFQ